MSGVGNSGGILEGWDHVAQSITTILTTPIGSRVMRRDFGSEISNLIDAPMNGAWMMAVFAASAQALEPRIVDGNWYGEPRFSLSQVELLSAGADGIVEIQVRGVFIPRGHLRDYSSTVEVAANIVF